jgi:hypothetical protein
VKVRDVEKPEVYNGFSFKVKATFKETDMEQ